MNRIGIILLTVFMVVNVGCKSQNFFWSHNCCCDTVPADTSCVEYGLLYNWFAIDDARKITSSDDWTVASRTQYLALTSYAGGDLVAGGKLKEAGYVYWDSPSTDADNSYGFKGRGTGERDAVTGEFVEINTSGDLWTSTPYAFNPTTQANIINFGYNTASSYVVGGTDMNTGFATRLVSDATGITDGTTTTYTGNDGQVYNAVAINELYWTTENLIETRFRNGDIIPFHGADNDSTFTNAEWAALTTAGVSAYNNDLSLVGCDFAWPIEP